MAEDSSRPPISGLSVVNLQIPETFMSACYPREEPGQQQFAAVPSAIYRSIVYDIYVLLGLFEKHEAAQNAEYSRVKKETLKKDQRAPLTSNAR